MARDSQINTQSQTCIQINLAKVTERAHVRAGDVAMEERRRRRRSVG